MKPLLENLRRYLPSRTDAVMNRLFRAVGVTPNSSSRPLKEAIERVRWEPGTASALPATNPVVDVSGPTTVMVFQDSDIRAVIEWPWQQPGKIVVPVLQNVQTNRAWAYAVYPDLISQAEKDQAKWRKSGCDACGRPCCP